jgi:hypothetical protein
MGSDPVIVVANSVTATTNPSIWKFMIQTLPYDLTSPFSFLIYSL